MPFDFFSFFLCGGVGVVGGGFGGRVQLFFSSDIYRFIFFNLANF